jgi:probable phosphoglycerate mutase
VSEAAVARGEAVARAAAAPGDPAPDSVPLDDQRPLLPEGLDATLALVRHGESEWIIKGLFQGQADSPLTERGRRQALLTARRIARRGRRPVMPLPAGPPLAVIHSPLARTTETATLIARAVNGGRGDDAVATPVPLIPEPGLLEIGQGEWEGLPGAEIVERWGPLLESWRRDPLSAWAPGGESVREVDARVRIALRRALADLATVAEPAVSGRSQVLGYGDSPGTEPWSILVGHDGVFKVTLLALLGLPLDRFWTLPFALCGISVVEIRNGRPRLRMHNATDHLAELQTVATHERDEARRRSGAL